MYTSNSSNSSSTATTTTAAGTTAADMFGLDAAVASAEVGTVYVLQYSVHDRAGNAAVGVQRAVVVVDTTPPEVTLYGAEEVHVLYATRYVEAGYSAQDVHDGNVTLQVVVSGAEAIDVHVAGTYEVEYAVTDANGNTGVAVRTVVVEALMRPERADQVVELVLAGTAESIFGGDVQQLERDLEEALNVDFVVVFLVYDKALGRPTTDINTVPQQQQGRKRRRSSGGSSRDSDNNDNNYSDSDNAWIRGRRGLLAQPSTVVEFGVRNGTSLEWVPAEGVAATLTEIRRAGSSSLPISSARSTGDEAEAGLPLPIIIGAAAGGIVLIVLIAVLVSRRRRSKAAPASISGGMFPFQHSGTFQESIYTVAGEGATVPMQEINFGKQRAAQQSYNHNHSQYPPPPPTNGGDLYGTPTNLPVVNGMVDGQVSESSLYHVPGHPEEVLAGRKTLVLQQGVNGGLPGAVSTDGDGELYDTPRSKPRVPDKAGSMRGAPVTADDYYGSLVHPGQRNHAMSNAGAGAGTDVDGQDMYDVPRNKPRVPEKSASIRKAAEALGDDYYGSLMHPDQQNGSMSNASVGGVGGEMYDVPRSKPRVPEKSASIRGTVTADDFYGSLVHPGQRSSSVNNADGNGNGDDGDMYDVPRNNPRVPSRAQAATATASVAESGVDDQEMYDVPRSAPRLPERTATMTSRATISGDGAEQPEDQELYDTPRAAPRPKPRMVLEQADAGDAVTDDQEMYDVPRSKPRPQPRPRKPTLTLDTNEYSALPTARPTNPSAPSSTNDVARGLPMQETGEELSWSERSRTLRRPPRTDNRVLDMFSSGDGGDGGGGGGGDHVDSSATGRRPTARSRPLTSGDDDPMRVQARALPGYIGEANRMLAEQKLAGSALGTYLWRVSASRAGAVLSVVGSRRTVHHMFTQDASGMILMNDKPLSQPCYDLQSAVALLHSHQEQMSSQLTTPLAQAPRRVVADTHTWLLPGLDRAAAKALLHDTPDGTFVVTPTDSSHFTLFLSYNFDVSSHRLSYGSHGWVLRQQFVPATTLEECVAALHDASYGLPCVLTGPPHQDAMA
ncbi:hypothetical protein PTSG_05573 [Salpingoeca rosetta]|uniref:Pesticidal crystal protein Cry22Aa Ig-like domain-containing protein n=1 Tax=Salpingoeca rosetta (strain ATCC 50818 / BSB-021) TaxID=946362 RepID=F2UBL2_SALR5|nr:uncharacterized protein PTSG_05573 [Salpingoeca rosetta]EGD73878.1 hypothetical protein PTSG_05573 [Salpingoeca rosetta]|eukprot:XP_004993441.1 hypothetical protein PTSG_05573 [Salpingoeca rosetta]